jgi:ribonuclease HI
MDTITVFTDGGARGNPGPSGIGVHVEDADGHTIGEFSKYIGEQTNNFAEYEAVAVALEALKKKFGTKTKTMQIKVKLDSELIQKQLINLYQIKEPTLFPQYIKVHNLIVSSFPNISFTHIPRAENAAADRLANEAMDRGR